MTLEDPYLWLEDIRDPRVVEWALKRDEKTRSFLGDVANALSCRAAELYSAPYLMSVRVGEKGYFILERLPSSYRVRLLTRDGENLTLVDSRDLGENVVIKQIYPSLRGDVLAFSASTGSDEGLARVIDVETGEVLDELWGVTHGFTWLDKHRYYYVRQYRREKTPDGVKPPASRVLLREDGSEEVVFGEGLPTAHYVSLYPSSDSTRALLCVGYGWSWCKAYGGRLDDPGTWDLIYGTEEFIAYPVDWAADSYIVVSLEGEGYGRVLAVRGEGDVRVVVAETRYPLKDTVVAGNALIAHYLVNASSSLVVYDLEGRRLREISFDAPGTVSSLSSYGGEAVFKYESFSTPYRLYRFKDGKLEVIEAREIEGDFRVEDVWTESSDGTKIHMFVFRKRSAKADRVLIYGYGGFGKALTPRFSPCRVMFVEDGGTFVVTNIRGGGEYGKKWHKAGVREKRQKVFEDFIACIEYFKRRGVKVVAMGISNGGLLVGAVLTQRPDLLDGAVIGYPVLDMLRFHKLYVGKYWVSEYGDPDNPKDAEYLLRYSPYHNVKKTKYPPTLVYTGFKDDRVHPAHALKFVAKLEEVGAPVLLRVERESGHSGAGPRIKLMECIDIMAFVYKVLGLKPGGSREEHA